MLPGLDDRNHPPESLRRDLGPEMQLDVAEAAGRQLELRGVKEEPRHVEPDLPVERIVRAAGEDARTRAVLARRCFDGDAGGVDLHARHARATIDDNPRRRRAFEQILIERAAIDDDGFDAIAGIHDFVPGGRPEARRGELVQQRSAGEVELVECIRRQNARAMDGLADARVFLQKGRPKSRGSQAGAGDTGPRARRR